MSCTKCNEQDPCVQVDCTCQLKLSTDCSTYTGNDLECSGIVKGTILTDVIQQLDAFICNKFNSVAAYFRVKNIGDGAEVYAGDDNLGVKQFRSFKKTGTLLTIDENTNDITYGIDEDALTEFVETNGKTITSNDGSINIVETTDNWDLSVVVIQNADIPRFIVNSAYDVGGSAPELGTLTKPFKTIQGALTKVVGTGTVIAPENMNAVIVIQQGLGYGNFVGDLAINTLTIELEPGTQILSDPINGWLIDLDAIAVTQKFETSIILSENSFFNLQKNGFRNSGTSTPSGGYTNFKKVSIKGNGAILQSIQDSTSSFPYVVFESNFASVANRENDGSEVFNVSGGTIATQTQPISKIGGTSRVIYNTSFTVANPGVVPNIGLVPFQQTGGFVNLSECGITMLFDALTVFEFTKSSLVPCGLFSQSTKCSGNIGTMYKINGTEQPSITVLDSTTTELLNVTNLVTSPTLLITMMFNGNFISSLANNFATQVDLTMNNTISVTNKIGSNIIESLKVFASRGLAAVSNPSGTAFIKRTIVTAANLVAGEEYKILTSGSPSLGTVGTYIIATGSETGTGTAYSYSRDIVL